MGPLARPSPTRRTGTLARCTWTTGKSARSTWGARPYAPAGQWTHPTPHFLFLLISIFIYGKAVNAIFAPSLRLARFRYSVWSMDWTMNRTAPLASTKFAPPG